MRKLTILALFTILALGTCSAEIVTDTFKMADDSLATGSLQIDFPYSCLDQSGQFIAITNLRVPVVAGSFTTTLIPNDTCNDTYYVVSYSLRQADGVRLTQTEYWIVPTSTIPLKLKDVQSPTVSPPAYQIPVSQIVGAMASPIVGDLVFTSATSSGVLLRQAGTTIEAWLGDSSVRIGLKLNALWLYHTAPAIISFDTNAGVDEGFWRFGFDGQYGSLTAYNDAFTSANSVWRVKRTGYSFDYFAVIAPLLVGGDTGSNLELKVSGSTLELWRKDRASRWSFAALNYTAYGAVDFSGASSTSPFKSGTTAPATCEPPQMFFDTDATAGKNLLACTSTNTWTTIQ